MKTQIFHFTFFMSISLILVTGMPFLQVSIAQDYTTLNLPEGAIARLGKGRIGGLDKSIAFSPDGKSFAVASGIGIWLYDVEAARELALLIGHQGRVFCLAYSPDSSMLVSGAQDGTVRLWDVATGENIATLEEHTSWISSVAFSSDGTTVASASRDLTIRLWDVATGENTITIEEHAGRPWSIAYSPTAPVLAAGLMNGIIQLWNTETGENIATFEGHPEWINSVAFSADGTMLASGADDYAVNLWNLETGENIATLEGHTDWVSAAAFAPDGATVASASADNTVRVWDVATGENIATLVEHNEWIPSVAFSPDGTTLASGSRDGTIRFWDTSTWENVTTFTGHDAALVATVVFSPDSTMLALGSLNSTIELRNVSPSESIAILRGHTNGVNSVAFSPDGTTLASGARDDTVKLWDVATGENIATLEGHTSWVESVAYSPNGTTLASGSDDGTVILWNASTGENIATLIGHTDTVFSVAYSPDGTVLASRAVDGTTLLWAVPESGEPTVGYVFETIKVPDVDFLELTSTNDLGDYAGNTHGPDGEKIIGFTLIDGVFSTYDVPDSLNVGFYGLNNARQTVGYYQDVNEISHGVIVQDGELTQFNFLGASETEIFGISETGQLIGDIFDAAGIIHGFVGDAQFDVPNATITYADDINAGGILVGSYIDVAGIHHGYTRHADGSFTNIEYSGQLSNLEYFFMNAINDAGVALFRAKEVDDVERSYILMPNGESRELRFPGSVTTIARDIDARGQVVGYYDTPDGGRHGFIARPATIAGQEDFSKVYFAPLSKGLNMLSVPLKPATPMNARSLAKMVGATTVIMLDDANQKFVGWTPDAPDDGFPIEGAKGYIVNVPSPRQVAFVGAPWTNQPQVAAGPSAISNNDTWAFVVSGRLESERNFDGYLVTVRNLQTNAIMTGYVRDGYFAVATADLSRQSVVQAGNFLEVTVTDATGEIASEKFSFTVTPADLANAVLPVMLDGVGRPKQSLLLQNYPNPFNPETWIPYHLSEAADVTLSIYNTTGQRVRTLSLGLQPAGFYQSRGRAAYWDGRNDLGERVSSGVYLYQLSAPSFHQMKRMVILK